MTADYLTEALRACRLPIMVIPWRDTLQSVLIDVISDDQWVSFRETDSATTHYTTLRDRLLQAEKETDNAE